jgi:hypothetical protein
MGKGYARGVVDKTIQREIINKYMGAFATNIMYLEKDSNVRTPDFEKMYKEVRKKFSKNHAERNVLAAKVTFYMKAAMYKEWVKYFFQQVDKYGIDTVGSLDKFAELNGAGWTIFQMIDDKKYLNQAVDFMKIVVNKLPWHHGFVDTYANLLYKVGRLNEALNWEQAAIDLVNENKWPAKKKEYSKIVDQMKKGEKTWTGKIF